MLQRTLTSGVFVFITAVRRWIRRGRAATADISSAYAIRRTRTGAASVTGGERAREKVTKAVPGRSGGRIA